MDTNVPEFIADLDAGVLEQKLGHALSQVALGVVNHDKPGKVKLTLDLSRIGNSYQVKIGATLECTVPRGAGKTTDEDRTIATMHVGKGGRMTFFPENQAQMFGKKGQVTEPAK